VFYPEKRKLPGAGATQHQEFFARGSPHRGTWLATGPVSTNSFFFETRFGYHRNRETCRKLLRCAMPGAVTVLLHRYCDGDRAVESELISAVYDELKRLARIHLRGAGRDRTLQPTALVNEAYLKLAGAREPQWQDRAHFFRVASRAMRQVITDYARQHLAEKRGGAFAFVPLEDAGVAESASPAELLQLHELLERLREADPRAHDVVELRCFGGLSVEETAAVLGTSPRTVKREWRTVKAWLRSELQRGRSEPCSTASGNASNLSSKAP
jgi:RNA polymerase sigma factor (TIGR02999 family)